MSSFVLSIADFLSGASQNMPLQGYNPPGDGSDFTTLDAEPRVVLNPIPAIITATRVAAKLGANAAAALQIIPHVDGADVGVGITIPMGSDTAAGVISPTLSQATGVGVLQTVKTLYRVLGTESSSIRILTAYQAASPFDHYSLICSGFSSSSNLGTTAPNGDFFQSFGGNTSTITENQHQIRWPNLPGTFKYLLGVSIHLNPGLDQPSITFRLRVNGATAIETAAVQVSSNPGYALNSTDTFHVNGGELVNFQGHHLGPYSLAASCRVLYAIGFLPD